MKFDRWQARDKSSWAWRIYKSHDEELMRMHIAFGAGRNSLYRCLKTAGVSWTDSARKELSFDNTTEEREFKDVRDWSNAFADLENWVNLSSLVALASNLETYIATIVGAALRSDIGVMYGASKKIDGIALLKHGRHTSLQFDDQIEGITKGDWKSRASSYEKIFGSVPAVMAGSLDELDKIRRIRNDVSHSFGRDLKKSRELFVPTHLPTAKLKKRDLLQFRVNVRDVAKAIDSHLYGGHVGEYQSTLIYHTMYPVINKDTHPSERAILLKREIGRRGDARIGKDFCKGLVRYYEAL